VQLPFEEVKKKETQLTKAKFYLGSQNGREKKLNKSHGK
jgi:hypothetical protein